MNRAPLTALLALPVLVALAACAGPPPTAADPETLHRIEADLLAIDAAIGRFQTQAERLPPDIGPALVEAGHLDAVRADPYASGHTFGSVTTYGYYTDYDDVCGEWYVVYSAGPDHAPSFVHDTREHRIVARGDDEIQTNLFVD